MESNDFSEHLTPEEWEELLLHYESESSPLENTWRCAEGVFASLWRQLAVLLLCALLQGFLAPLRRSHPRLHNSLVILLGIFCLVYVLPSWITVAIVVAYALLFGLLKALFGMGSHFGLLSASFSLVFLLGCQNILEDSTFLAFRGTLMIQIMKSISVSFSSEQIPHASLLGYLLNPGTLVLGPYVPYAAFAEAEAPLRRGVTTLSRAFVSFVTCLVFLFSSTCVVEELLEPWGSTHWLLDAYKKALSFRLGHYYVSGLSAALCLLAGVETPDVSDWKSIEAPRSMVDVVVGWNVPMNQFLHQCVFSHMRRYGHLVAVMSTFLASSLLHGFNFQLTAVLLSLGLYSFSEHQFRAALSRRMNACVRARKCPESCSHIHKSLSLRTALVNFFFSALAVFHLIYLGMVFDNSESEETGYSMAHTLSKWAEWKFSSHLLALALFLLRWIVL